MGHPIDCKTLFLPAEMGGYIGLFLGVSLFKLADVNSFFLDWHMEKEVVKARIKRVQNIEVGLKLKSLKSL